MSERIKELAEAISEAERVRVITHIDADGLSSAGIICSILHKEEKQFSVKAIKQLDKDNISELFSNMRSDLLILTDLGSGQADKLPKNKGVCIIDHHQPVSSEILQLNPHFFGIDGSREVSSSGLCYLVAREMGYRDLSPLAIVGAVGDNQDSRGELLGLNKEILKEAEKEGLVIVEKDIRIFGRQTRPLFKALEYTTNPYLPGISGSERGAIEFLEEIGVPLKRGDKWVRLVDLTEEEKKKVLTGLVMRIVKTGGSVESAKVLVGEVYTFPAEKGMLRDAKEYSTLLNACGRRGFPGVGIAVAMGDRNENLRKAESILDEYRREVSEAIELLQKEGLKEKGILKYFLAGDRIRDTVIGTVTSMLMGRREEVLVGMANSENGKVKVSARTTRELTNKGVNLGIALRRAAESVGGDGGGHSVAAGAKIPRGREMDLIEFLEKEIERQVNEIDG